MNYIIRKATLSDLSAIEYLYKIARHYMQSHGNPDQWGDRYPDKNQIMKDISEDCLYVIEDDRQVEAVFYYRFGIEPTYLRIESGAWLDEEPYGYLHRVASSGHLKRCSDIIINWAFNQCNNLRCDTHEKNKAMRNALKRNGFSYCGIIYVETARLAFQKR